MVIDCSVGKTAGEGGSDMDEGGSDMDKETGPILVAIDFSPDSHSAVAWALRQAKAYGVALHFVHVVHESVEQSGFYHENPEDVSRPMIEVAEDMLNQYLKDIRKEFPIMADIPEVESILVRGLPPTRIVEVAEKINASEIVMGCRGLTGLSRLILGSQAERVIQISSVPVTIVKSEVTQLEDNQE